MLDLETRRRIDNARDILVGKVPDPKSQVEQITIALIYKFMDDMDKEAVELGGKATFFKGEFAKYSWSNIFDPKLGGYELINLYGEAITKMNQNKYIPQLFRGIFKNAFLPYRDPETLKSFLKEINNFHYDHSERLGDAFEYLLSVLGVQGDAGSLRTPRHIIDFIVEVIAPKKNETILDPSCGTGGFLISAYKHIIRGSLSKPPESPLSGGLATSSPDKGRSGGVCLTPDDRKRLMNSITGYDISPDMVRLSLVNMYLHGFQTPNIYEYDSLTSDDRWNDTFDIILANPPFMTPKGGIRPHKRFQIQANRSEVLFVDYIMEHIATDGRAGVIVPEGIIFQSGNAYKALRKELIENNYLYAVVSLPAGVFNPYSGVKTSILLMDRTLAKRTKDILFIKIENDGFDLGAQRREIDKNDLPDALEVIKKYQEFLRTGSDRYGLFTGRITPPNLPLSGEEDATTHEPFIPYKRELTDVAKMNRKNPTKAENKLWNEVLRRKKLESYKFIRQKPIDNFIVDFYCSKLKLVIEIDGDSHNEKQEYDELRTQILQKYGLHVIRYTNEDVLNNIEGIYEDLMKRITPPNLPLSGEGKISPPDKGDLGGFHIVPKTKIAESGDYNLTGDKYREKIVYSHKDWPMVELGSVLQNKPQYGSGAAKSPFDGKNRYIRITDITDSGILKDDEMVSPSILEKECLLTENDFLIARSGSVGRSYLHHKNNLNCYFAGYLIRFPLDFKKVLAKYVFFLTRGQQFADFINRYRKDGTLSNINAKEYQEFLFPLPPLSVQQEIVAEIEGYQKIIDGARQIVENYKPKIKVDESWERVELGEVCSFMTGGTPTSTVKEYYENGTIPWLVSGDIHKGEIFDCEGRITKKGVESSNAKYLSKDSVLIALNGQGKTRGTVALLRMEKATCNQSLVSVNPKDKNTLVPEFIYYQLKSMYQEIREITGDNQRSGLNISIVKAIKIPLPPLNIQKQIVAQIEEEQKLIEANKKLIEIFEQKIKAKIAEVWG